MTDPSSVTTTPRPSSFLHYSVPDVRWGWLDVVYGLAVFFLALGLQIVVVLAVEIPADSVDVVGFVASAVAYSALVAVVIVASRRKGLGTLAADFGVRFRWVDLALGLGAGLLVKIFAVVLGVIAVTLTRHQPEQGNFVLSPDPLWIVLNGVIIASLLAPFVEELFFRGLVLRAARNRVLRRGGSQARAAVIAIAVSSVGFALMHMWQSPDLTLLVILGGSTLALGVVNALLVLATGRIGAAVIAHVFFNVSSILLAVLVS